MSKKVHQAFLISLCLHLLSFICFRILLEKDTVYEDEDKATIVADILPPVKPHIIPRKFKLESNTPTEQRKLGKSIKSFLFSHNDIDIEQPSFRSALDSQLCIFKIPQLSLKILLSVLLTKN